MATTRKTRKATQRDVIYAMAEFIAALGPLESKASAARDAVLAKARALGWKG